MRSSLVISIDSGYFGSVIYLANHSNRSSSSSSTSDKRARIWVRYSLEIWSLFSIGFNLGSLTYPGKFDFVLHSIGMSLNVRKKRHYTNQNHEWTKKGWDISALSFHKLLQVLYEKDALNQWGSIVALTYIAAQRTFPNYNDMADNKAYLESIARSFGYFFGKNKKVRINTISQSPTRTTAGQGVEGLENFLNFSEKTSPLGNASAFECAQYVVSLFSDFTRKVTMQNLFHDGGFSTTGVGQEIIEDF